jgi:hypothetical protein
MIFGLLELKIGQLRQHTAQLGVIIKTGHPVLIGWPDI